MAPLQVLKLKLKLKGKTVQKQIVRPTPVKTNVFCTDFQQHILDRSSRSGEGGGVAVVSLNELYSVYPQPRGAGKKYRSASTQTNKQKGQRRIGGKD